MRNSVFCFLRSSHTCMRSHPSADVHSLLERRARAGQQEKRARASDLASESKTEQNVVPLMPPELITLGCAMRYVAQAVAGNACQFCPTRATSGRHRPNSAEIGPNSANTWPTSVDIDPLKGQICPNSGHRRPRPLCQHAAKSAPSSTDVRANLTKSSTNLPRIDQPCPGIGRIWPGLDQLRPNIGRIWPGSEIGRTRATLAIIGAGSTKCGPRPSKSGPMLAPLSGVPRKSAHSASCFGPLPAVAPRLRPLRAFTGSLSVSGDICPHVRCVHYPVSPAVQLVIFRFGIFRHFVLHVLAKFTFST